MMQEERQIASCLAMTNKRGRLLRLTPSNDARRETDCFGLRLVMTQEERQIASAYASQRLMKPGFIYILTNKNNTTLYVGVTGNIINRIQQHKQKYNRKSFTARYNLDKLVYYEAFQQIGDAIAREKQLKAGSRAKKIALIETDNPNWDDLTEQTQTLFN